MRLTVTGNKGDVETTTEKLQSPTKSKYVCFISRSHQVGSENIAKAFQWFLEFTSDAKHLAEHQFGTAACCWKLRYALVVFPLDGYLRDHSAP